MIGYAKGVGIDEAKFKPCLADPQTRLKWTAPSFGQQVGVPTVPAFLFMDSNQTRSSPASWAPTFSDFETQAPSRVEPAGRGHAYSGEVRRFLKEVRCTILVSGWSG